MQSNGSRSGTRAREREGGRSKVLGIKKRQALRGKEDTLS